MNQNLKNKYLYNSALGIVCVLIVVILAWGDNPGFRAVRFPGAENSFYNLLIQGFNAGHLNIITNPNDLAANANILGQVGDNWDMINYKGKIYIYFGVAPAILLYWPYNFLTGDFLSDQAAVFIFLSTGFLALAFLLYSIWKRYFRNVGFWVLGLCIFIVGFAIGTLQAEWWWSDVYEVALSSAFAFSMLSLVAIWQAMHQVKRKIIWLLLASLTYGLTIASRPTLLYGAIILLIPLIYECQNVGNLAVIRKIGPFFLAAICPIGVIGAGLMIYNFLRFGNPFEFGVSYQISCNPSDLFNVHFFWFNFYYYFLELMRWTAHFPFLQTFDPPVPPLGHGPTEKDCGGILLVNYPLALTALAAALTWRRKEGSTSAPLRWLVLIASIVFASAGLVICFYCATYCRYELDFLPALMILSVIGVFNLEQKLTGVGRRIARFAWCLLLADTLVFNTLASVDGHATADYYFGNFLIRVGRANEAVEYLEKAVALEPGSAPFQKALGTAYQPDGMVDKAIAQYEKALAIDPNDAGSEYFIGSALFQKGESAEAIKHFNLALKLDSHCFDSHGNYGEHTAIAWSFATNADPGKRDASLAIKFAERACQETSNQMAIVVGTLAAAYAEAERYDDAVATARKAIAVAEKQGDPNIAQRNRDFLALYLKHQPFHQAGP